MLSTKEMNYADETLSTTLPSLEALCMKTLFTNEAIDYMGIQST